MSYIVGQTRDTRKAHETSLPCKARTALAGLAQFALIAIFTLLIFYNISCLLLGGDEAKSQKSKVGFWGPKSRDVSSNGTIWDPLVGQTHFRNSNPNSLSP